MTVHQALNALEIQQHSSSQPSAVISGHLVLIKAVILAHLLIRVFIWLRRSENSPFTMHDSPANVR